MKKYIKRKMKIMSLCLWIFSLLVDEDAIDYKVITYYEQFYSVETKLIKFKYE